jgi:hypothetical protein
MDIFEDSMGSVLYGMPISFSYIYNRNINAFIEKNNWNLILDVSIIEDFIENMILIYKANTNNFKYSVEVYRKSKSKFELIKNKAIKYNDKRILASLGVIQDVFESNNLMTLIADMKFHDFNDIIGKDVMTELNILDSEICTESEFDKACRLLKIEKNASFNDIKKSFRSLMRIHHPDKGGDSNICQEINWAYEFLNRYHLK